MHLRFVAYHKVSFWADAAHNQRKSGKVKFHRCECKQIQTRGLCHIRRFFRGCGSSVYSLGNVRVAGDLFWSASGEVILMGLLGGMHLFLGPALGAAIMVLLNSFLTSYTEHWGMFLGTTLVVIVLFIPEGVGGLIQATLACSAKGRRAQMVILEVKGIRKSFGGVVAVDGVDLQSGTGPHI